MKKNQIKESKKRSLRLKVDNPLFTAACQKAGIKPTLRQWTKWTKERGAAFNFKKG